MPSRERSVIPCPLHPAHPTLYCTCSLLPELVKFINQAGHRRSYDYHALQHLGFDQVSPQLIQKLLTNPEGSASTTAFSGGEFTLSFQEPDIRSFRNRLAWRYFDHYFVIEDENHIHCHWLLEYCRQMGITDPRDHLNYLRTLIPDRSSRSRRR